MSTDEYMNRCLREYDHRRELEAERWQFGTDEEEPKDDYQEWKEWQLEWDMMS